MLAGLTLTDRLGTTTVPISTSALELWEEWYGNLSPESVANLLSQYMRQPLAIRVWLHMSSSSFRLFLKDEKTPVGSGKRRLLRSPGGETYAYHHIFVLEESYQGKGMVARLLKNLLDMYQPLGITKVRLTAGLSQGGQIWPAYGFRPEGLSQWRQVGDQVRARLRRLRVPAQREREIRDYLDGDDPREIWALRDLKAPELAQEFPHGLGKSLLNGTRWQGILDLGDTLAVIRLKDAFRRKL
ncbi:MAG: GNAT family N-acetyltransferase [Planctomycetes bacterium]|nr:GNAT family N-acetyltransferase [Planctomycetota bacterium]